MNVSLVIPGQPVAKGRPRISARGGFARAYTPSKTRHYEDLIRLEAGRVMAGRPPTEGAVSVVVDAYVAAPKSLSKKALAEALDGSRRPITRPDCDNYCKAALDGVNGIVFRDDSQVVNLTVRKFYSDRPRLVVVVEDA